MTHPPLAVAPVGVWLIAGTALAAPYPCRCEFAWYGQQPYGGAEGGRWLCRAWRCCCFGRRDLANVPRECCARDWVS